MIECKSGPLMNESHKLFFSLPQLLRKSETVIYLSSSEIPQTNSMIAHYAASHVTRHFGNS